MKLVKCISPRINSDILIVGNHYYIDINTLYSDDEGEWYVEVFTYTKDSYFSVGYMALKHFIEV